MIRSDELRSRRLGRVQARPREELWAHRTTQASVVLLGGFKVTEQQNARKDDIAFVREHAPY
jgi:hypothetical protein